MASIPLQPAIYDFSTLFIYLCFFCPVLRLYISNLTSRPVFARTGKGKKTDLSYTQDIFPLTRHPHFIYFFFICFAFYFFFSSWNDIFTLVPV